MFGTVLTAIATLFHVYVFWHADRLELRKKHVPRKVLYTIAVCGWIVFFLGRAYGHHGKGFLARLLEITGMHWMAALFILSTALLGADLLSGFGLFFKKHRNTIRNWAFSIGIGMVLLAHIQGLRPPIINKYTVRLPELKPALEGTTIAVLADLHAGETLSADWLAARVKQTVHLKPDIIILAGDIFEGHGESDPALAQALGQLSAPLGVYAVRGNHDRIRSHRPDTAGILLGRAGIPILSNQWQQPAQGLVIAGVDDLNSYRRNPDRARTDLAAALNGRPEGITILASHTPLLIKEADAAGVDLMVSGHTHGGQIWPFNWIVKMRYSYAAGKHTINRMQLIVSRGTGTWGPRMRLWKAGEITLITLQKEEEKL